MPNIQKFTILCGLFLLLTWSPSCIAGSRFDPAPEYTWLFRYSQARWLAWHSPDWAFLRAQCYAESALNPQAASAYARGLCQFTPSSWAYITGLMGMDASIWSPKAQVFAAGFYMNRLLRAWRPRSCLERYRFAWGSYNAGMGTILRNQREAGGAMSWAAVRIYAPKETRDYTDRIERLRARLTQIGGCYE